MFFKFYVEPSVEVELKMFTNGYCPLIKMAAVTKYGRTLTNRLLQNAQSTFKSENYYIALGIQGLPSLFK